jgi:predicted amidophosphoribosyltransferase
MTRYSHDDYDQWEAAMAHAPLRKKQGRLHVSIWGFCSSCGKLIDKTYGIRCQECMKEVQAVTVEGKDTENMSLPPSHSMSVLSYIGEEKSSRQTLAG